MSVKVEAQNVSQGVLLCMCMWVSVPDCTCVRCVWICVQGYMCEHLYVCLCVCVFLSVCICV